MSGAATGPRSFINCGRAIHATQAMVVMTKLGGHGW